MSSGHTGALARLREYAATVADFGLREAAAAIGTTERRAFNQVRQMVKAGQLHHCGPRGNNLRRYATSANRAAEINAECAPVRLDEEGMRRKIGQCLGGLRDLDGIKVRSAEDEDSGCWNWKGATTKGNGSSIPTASIDGTTKSVVRWVWGLKHPAKPLAASVIVWRTCTNDLCVNPAHLASGTRQQWGKSIRDSQAWKNRITYRAANKAQGQKRTVVTTEYVSQIKAGNASPQEVAQKLGVHESSVYRAMRRTTLVANASVFNWRPKEAA